MELDFKVWGVRLRVASLEFGLKACGGLQIRVWGLRLSSLGFWDVGFLA